MIQLDTTILSVAKNQLTLPLPPLVDCSSSTGIGIVIGSSTCPSPHLGW